MQSNISILVVEDDFIIRSDIIGKLKSLGYYQIFEAKNSDEAFQVLDKHHITIVFMDIMLNKSKMDGIEITREINMKYPLTFIIFLTSVLDEKTLEKATSVLHKNFLIKPIIAQQLYASIKMALLNQSSVKDGAYNSNIGFPFLKANNEIFVKRPNDTFYYRVQVSEIILIESNYKGIDIVTPNETFFNYCSLIDVVSKINNPNITQVHKKYAINRAHISSLSSRHIVMNNSKVIPIGRTFKKDLDSLGLITI